jgi:hypothetical protein
MAFGLLTSFFTILGLSQQFILIFSRLQVVRIDNVAVHSELFTVRRWIEATLGSSLRNVGYTLQLASNPALPPMCKLTLGAMGQQAVLAGSPPSVVVGIASRAGVNGLIVSGQNVVGSGWHDGGRVGGR